MKVIISEKILTEVKPLEKDRVVSQQYVYVGKNRVTKKIKNPTEKELEFYNRINQLMADNPEFFVKTRMTKSGWVVQETIDVRRQKEDYEMINGIFRRYCNDFDFYSVLTDEFFKNQKDLYYKKMSCLLKTIKTTKDEELLYKFKRFLTFFKKFGEFYKKTYHIHEGKFPDLHEDNLGYDKNGDIKIIDFLNLRTKSKYDTKSIKNKALSKKNKDKNSRNLPLKCPKFKEIDYNKISILSSPEIYYWEESQIATIEHLHPVAILKKIATDKSTNKKELQDIYFSDIALDEFIKNNINEGQLLDVMSFNYSASEDVTTITTLLIFQALNLNCLVPIIWIDYVPYNEKQKIRDNIYNLYKKGYELDEIKEKIPKALINSRILELIIKEFEHEDDYF